MSEEINKPEGAESGTEMSPEQKRKMALQAELEIRKILFSTKNKSYKKEFTPKMSADEKTIEGFDISNPITPESPYNHIGKQTRRMRRGVERVSFSLIGNSVQTHFERKNKQGKWTSN